MDFVHPYANYEGFWNNQEPTVSVSTDSSSEKCGSSQKVRNSKRSINYTGELSAIIEELVQRFRFQEDNAANMEDYLIQMWKSRSARYPGAADQELTGQALISLYEDYIWGVHANFGKWYGFLFGKEATPSWFVESGSEIVMTREVLLQLSLWLLIWGESNNLRVMPELLCFIFDMMMTEYKFKVNKDKKNGNKNHHLYQIGSADEMNDGSAPQFLSHVVTPLYEFYQFQITWNKENDHSHIIGYDDINQCFWSLKSIKSFKLKDGSVFWSLSPSSRYLKFNEIEWSKSLKKTYLEKRTWIHLITNFHRIWILHVSTFWYFSIINLKPLYTKYYVQTLDNEPDLFIFFSMMALAGTLVCSLTLAALAGELIFVPRDSNLRRPTKLRGFIVCIFLTMNLIPPLIILTLNDTLRRSHMSGSLLTIISFISFVFSLLTTVVFSVTPLSHIQNIMPFFKVAKISRSYSTCSGVDATGNHSENNEEQRDRNNRKSRWYLQYNMYFPDDSDNPFTENWCKKEPIEVKIASVGIWTMIWASKLTETFFFLCRSIKDPARNLMLSQLNCSGTDTLLSSALCPYWSRFLLGLLLVTNFVLYLLDTYLWYVIYNTIFSLVRSVYMGVTQLTPWRNVFLNLTNKMKFKLLPGDQEWDISVIAELWNEIIYSMYKENLICSEHVERLVFHRTSDNNLLKPSLLSSADDHFFRSKLFKRSRGIQRRLTFFAQSLHCPMPEPDTVENMPIFTVLIPHYKEKILLSLKDIIKAETENSSITLLEYLKLIHPTEWSSFIEETNLLMHEDDALMPESPSDAAANDDKIESASMNSDGQKWSTVNISKMTTNHTRSFDAFKFTGFKIDVPEQTIRTRIWASLRTQTLYRTVTGFMKYQDAIRILHKLESTKKGTVNSKKTLGSDSNSKAVLVFDKTDGSPKDDGDDTHFMMASRKFHMVCSMQRMNSFSDEEKADRNILLAAFPSLKIAYVEDEIDKNTGKKVYFSCLIDGFCDIDSKGEFIPKYRIRLSGDPILGNGKSDNQNHAIIFTRGEYIQLIDANQENYLEECLKIKSILKEFEEDVPFSKGGKKSAADKVLNPVAIVGTREHIFSENNGVLGDIAAGKEKVFGTFFARTLGYINSKLHYGHPDFINSIFINTRGGVSKAQRGLHLNEDIFVGMNVIMRGGRIKHSEYYQCGKGRDLSFHSILNFTTKIGSGMGEQLLSREYFYLGTALPLDRYLSFYFAHPGFHLNNIFVYISLCLFLIIILNLAVMIDSSVLCVYESGLKQTDPWEPDACLQLVPLLTWLRRSTIVLFLISLVSFLPLMFQHINDRGIVSAMKRLSKQFVSGAVFFEVFSSRIASQALITDIMIGDAKYLSTTRGLSFERIPFISLFNRFANDTMYLAGCAFVVLTYASMVMWDVSLLYFWMYFTALLLSPFIFNPSQFHWVEFISDYRITLTWFTNWQKKNSWVKHARTENRMFQLSERSNFKWYQTIWNNVWCHILPQSLVTFFTVIPFIIANINNSDDVPVNSALRLIIVTACTLAINCLILLTVFMISSVYGIFVIQGRHQWLPRLLSKISVFTGIMSMAISYILLSSLQRWDGKSIVLGILASLMIQKLLYQVIKGVIMPFRWNDDKSNDSWWNGKWFRRHHSFFDPMMEYIKKVLELSVFSIDFILAHGIFLLQLPILLVPNVDKLHSMMLYWRRADIDARPILFRDKWRQTSMIRSYSIMFVMVLGCLVTLVCLPLIFSHAFIIPTNLIPQASGLLSIWQRLVQPASRISLQSEIGLSAYHNMMASMFHR